MTQNDTPLTEVSLILMNQSKLSSFSILHEKKKKTKERTNKTTIKHPAPRQRKKKTKDRKCSLQISAEKIYSQSLKSYHVFRATDKLEIARSFFSTDFQYVSK